MDLQLAAGSAAVDKGVVLAGINDGFAGAAPDLGAYELGVAPPVYGPRTGGSGGATGAGGAVGTGGRMGTGGGPGMGGAVGLGGAEEVGNTSAAGGTTGGGGAAETGGLPGAGGAIPGASTTAGKAGGCSCTTASPAGRGEVTFFGLAAFLALRWSYRRSRRPVI